MTEEQRRRHDRSFKLWIVGRIEGGESVASLSSEYGIKGHLLYRWRNAVRAGGEVALRDPGRPRRAVSASIAQDTGGELRDLRAARGQIEALQRKIGEQQMALDFLGGALRRIEASRRPNDGLGETRSTPRSRR
jgi:transposase-like protein